MTKGIHGGSRAISIPSRHKPFGGLIGDLRIYKQAVAADRVQQLFQEEAGKHSSTQFRVQE